MPPAEPSPAGDYVALAGRTALVTGGAKRIGRAICQALAAAGVHVVIHYRDSGQEAQALAGELEAAGVRAHVCQGDLAQPGAAEAVFESARSLAGPIDFLVNSASIFPEHTLWDADREAIHANVDVNAAAPFILGRAFALQAREGAIINLLDTMIMDNDRRHFAYHLSKRMLHTLTRLMAVEFAPKVRVNAVAPGLVLPPAGEDTAYLERLHHSNPLQCHGSPRGVAEAVLFLLRSTFITGQVIFVDGGRHLRGSMYG